MSRRSYLAAATGGRSPNSLYASRPGAGTIHRPGGGHGSFRVLTSAASPHGRPTVAQGQRRDRPFRRGKRAPGRSVSMPKFMDVHHGMVGITAEALVAAHAGDLAIQADEGVSFEHAWADPESGNVFCRARMLSNGSTPATASRPPRSTRSRSKSEAERRSGSAPHGGWCARPPTKTTDTKRPPGFPRPRIRRH
jgi:hypothetical protein